jgi:DNA-binding HxlR family transcriptional regulator
MRGYGQYCPVALAAEVFAERWTPIIIRNLMIGCERFGEVLDGAPGCRAACCPSGCGGWKPTA